nr:DNA-directed DNA polymerase [Tanacetum cinerariifolium]
MEDNRMMEEMLQASTEGYGDAIVVPDILTENFEIKTCLLSLIQANQFHGFECNNPHDHIRSFNRITLTLKFRDVSNDAIKLMLFPYSIDVAAKTWYAKEPPRSILTWGISITVANPMGDLKAITTQSGVSYDEPPILPPTSSLPKVVERDPEGDKGYGTDKLPVVISKELKDEEKSTLLKILKSNKWAIAWKISDIKGIDPRFCTHKILMEDDFKPMVQHQRRVNSKIHEVIQKEVIKLLDARLIYPIYDSPWVSPIHCVPKKGGMTVVENEDNELIPTRCMMAIFHDMIQKTMEVFMDDFSVFRDSFSLCLSYLDQMLQRCEDTNLVLNWEECHFMVKEGIVLGHKISKSGIKVDKDKVDVIAKLPHLTSVKGVKNLTADHLFRLENPHQDELEKKEITKTFPLETLGMIAFHGDSSTPWIALDLEASCARDFVHRPLKLQSLAYGNLIS